MHAEFKLFQQRLLMAVVKQRAIVWLAVTLPWIIMRSPWGLAACGAFFLMDYLALRRRISLHCVTWINAAFPEMEDSAMLLQTKEPLSAVGQLQSARLFVRLSGLFTDEKLGALARQVLPFRRAYLLLSCVVAAFVWLAPNVVQPTVKRAQNLGASKQAQFEISLTITPPAYTGIAAYQSTVRELQVPQHSVVEWCVVGASGNTQEKNAQSVKLSDGVVLELRPAGDPSARKNASKLCAQWEANQSVFWTWSADAQQTRTVLSVVLDQAPVIKIEAPQEMVHILQKDAKTVMMEVSISDDYRVVDASVHLTLARGSGENIRFSDKEVIIAATKNQKLRQWKKLWTLSELGIEAGDELFFFVRARDNAAPTPHIVTSPTYAIRLPAIEQLDEETSVVPILVKPESLRSQRQIIIDTEQLLSDMRANSKLSPALIRARSEKIASDQGTLRRRYGHFLGEESSLFSDGKEDHNEHNEHSEQRENKPVDLAAQYGHAHDQAENATLFDETTKKILRRVLSAMWDAEKSLRAITPKTALAPENSALEAIKQLQQADRIYLHKAAFLPPAIKEEKRLTGDALDVKNIRFTQADTSKKELLAMQTLMQGLSNNEALPALWSTMARTWIAERLTKDDQRLAAQAALQDVLEGCLPCRPVLAAWLRQGWDDATILLQATPRFNAHALSPFEASWRTNRAGDKR